MGGSRGAWCFGSRGPRGALALLGLLALATQAHAEGAWVLWSQKSKSGRGGGYTVIETFPADIPGKPNVLCARWAKTFAQRPEFRDQTFICLPEAVDPRGPTGEAKREKPRRP